MPTTVTARTADLPVSPDEAKAHLRVLNGDTDEYIQTLIAAATEYCEGVTGRSLRVSETVVQNYDCWPSCRFQLDRQPAIAVTSLKYYDADGTLQTVGSSNYRLHKSRNAAAYVEIDGDYSQPTHDTREDAIQLTYTAGYESIDDVEADDDTPMVLGVPAIAKHAIKIKLGLLFGNLDPRVIDNEENRLADCLAQLDWGCYR
jgi:uncharacterized phiE125 gp8 family phage protein